MNKKIIKLTESDLHRIVKESVNRVLNEGDFSMKLRKFEEMASDSLESIAQSLGLWTNRSGNGIIEFGDDNESGLLVKFERY